MREDEAKEAMFDGKDARRAGQPITANDRIPGTLEWNAWNEGWNFERAFPRRRIAA